MWYQILISLIVYLLIGSYGFYKENKNLKDANKKIKEKNFTFHNKGEYPMTLEIKGDIYIIEPHSTRTFTFLS